MHLNLSICDITATDPDTARSLTKMLQMNKTLTHLNLSENNRFSYSRAQCIFESLSTLVRTSIAATDPDTARSVTKILQVNKSLTHLDHDLSCMDTIPANESDYLTHLFCTRTQYHSTSRNPLWQRNIKCTHQKKVRSAL